MNKQQILNEIEELKEKLNNLEKQYEALTSPNNRWRGEKQDIYYRITAEGEVYRSVELDTITDDSHYTLGNYFKTEEEAKFEIERLKVIAKLKEWSTPISELNWNDDTELKYMIELRTAEGKISLVIDYCLSCLSYQNSDLYFQSEEVARNAIKAVGEERIIKYYFRRGERI